MKSYEYKNISKFGHISKKNVYSHIHLFPFPTSNHCLKTCFATAGKSSSRFVLRSTRSVPYSGCASTAATRLPPPHFRPEDTQNFKQRLIYLQIPVLAERLCKAFQVFEKEKPQECAVTAISKTLLQRTDPIPDYISSGKLLLSMVLWFGILVWKGIWIPEKKKFKKIEISGISDH